MTAGGRGFGVRQAVWLAAVAMVCLALTVLTGCGTGVTTNPASGQTTPVSLQTLSLPAATVGVAYSTAVLAQDGTAPYTFTLASGSLPAGLSLASSSGVISGTPTTAGATSFVVQVTDAKSGTATATLGLTVNAAVPPSITTTTLPSGKVGVAYSTTLAASNGTTPYSFSLVSGSLPAGLTLSSTGTISGTPATAGTASFSIKLTDKNALSSTASFSVTIAAATPVSILTASLPAGTVGVSYAATISATNGTLPYSYSVAAGALPAGLTLSTSGAITGTPTAAGTANVTIQVTDASSQTATQSYTLTIAAASSGLAIATTTLPNGQVGTPYQATVSATGGTAPYSFSLSLGSLPAGLALASDGLIKGTPTAAGDSSISVTVTDAQGKQASATLSIHIAAAGALTITTASLPSGTYAVAYSTSLQATGGSTPYAFSITGGQIPAGLTLTSGGVLAGTPIVGDASSTFTVTVTDAASNRASATYTVSIVYSGPPALAVAPATLPVALVNTSYTANVYATGGTSPYSYLMTGGTLPTGMTFRTDGTISGIATTAGTYTIQVKAGDSSTPQQTATATITLTVASVSATVTVDATKTKLTVPANFYELHTSVYDTSLNDTANLPGLLSQTGVSVLRYPGGGYSDNYHWAQYAVTPFSASSAPACGTYTNAVLASDGDFGTFARLLKASGTQAMITVNYGTSVANSAASKSAGADGKLNCEEPNTYGQPQEAAAWVAYANGSATSTQVIGVDAAGFDWKTVGYWASLRAASPLSTDDGLNFLRLGLTSPLGIRYWEIGNEIYYNGWATNHNAETDDHAPYIYPSGYTPGGYNSRNAVDALSPTSYGTNAIQWIQAMKSVDPTIQIGLAFSSPIATDPIPANWNPDLAKAACAGANFDFAIMHYYPGTYLDVQARELLALPQVDIPNVVANIQSALATYCPANASQMKVYLTETSPNGPLDTSFPKPALGLFTINDYLSALTAGVGMVGWLELHDGTYLTESEQPGPSYFGYQMAHLAAAPGDGLLTTTSSSPYVLAWSTAKATGGEALLLINADPSNSALVSVQVSGVAMGSTATQYSYGLATSQSGTALTPSTVTIPGTTFPVSVPPYTAVVLLLH